MIGGEIGSQTPVGRTGHARVNGLGRQSGKDIATIAFEMLDHTVLSIYRFDDPSNCSGPGRKKKRRFFHGGVSVAFFLNERQTEPGSVFFRDITVQPSK